LNKEKLISFKNKKKKLKPLSKANNASGVSLKQDITTQEKIERKNRVQNELGSL